MSRRYSPIPAEHARNVTRRETNQPHTSSYGSGEPGESAGVPGMRTGHLSLRMPLCRSTSQKRTSVGPQHFSMQRPPRRRGPHHLTPRCGLRPGSWPRISGTKSATASTRTPRWGRKSSRARCTRPCSGRAHPLRAFHDRRCVPRRHGRRRSRFSSPVTEHACAWVTVYFQPDGAVHISTPGSGCSRRQPSACFSL